MFAMNIASASNYRSPWLVSLPRRFERTNVKRRVQAVLGPDQLLTEICGKARVPSAVRERLIVTFVKEQQQLQQLQQ